MTDLKSHFAQSYTWDCARLSITAKLREKFILGNRIYVFYKI